MSTSVAGADTPAARPRRARPCASSQTAEVMASSGTSRSNSRSTFFSRSPPAPFQSSNRTSGHQCAVPAWSSAATLARIAPRPWRERRQALQQFHRVKHQVRRSIGPAPSQLQHRCAGLASVAAGPARPAAAGRSGTSVPAGRGCPPARRCLHANQNPAGARASGHQSFPGTRKTEVTGCPQDVPPTLYARVIDFSGRQ